MNGKVEKDENINACITQNAAGIETSLGKFIDTPWPAN